MSDEEKEPEHKDASEPTPEKSAEDSEAGTPPTVSAVSPSEAGSKPETETSAPAPPASAESEPPGPEKPPTKPAKKVVKKAAKKVAKKKGLVYEDLQEDALLEELRERFAEGILSGQSFLGQATYTVSLGCLYEVMIFLRDSPRWAFDYLVDLTALDYLGDEKRFCLVYHLYANQGGTLVRIKSRAEEDELVPSVTSIWRTAGWMEREVYDLFGIEFSGHSELKRILLPDDWHGYPLRKDYDIKLQDQAWIKKHLDIRKTPA